MKKEGQKLMRLGFVAVMLIVIGVAVAGCTSTSPSTPTATGSTPAASTTPAPWLTSPGLNTEQQGLYHFPIDHQFHSGPTYHYDDYKEWHYFTFLGKDLTTGHNISLFLLNQAQGYQANIQRPQLINMVAYLDKDTGKFYPHTIMPTSPFVTTGSNGNFDYVANDVSNGLGFETSYTYDTEQWHFKEWGTNASTMAAGTPFSVDLTGNVKAPGYMPMAYWGLENIGFNDQYTQNPSTMYGLSYYYTAPQMDLTGTVTLDDGVVHKIQGTAWFEHQWGNFQSPEQARYVWGYARFPNGDAMTWRQYYGSPAGIVQVNVSQPFNNTAAMMGWTDPQPQQSRFTFLPNGGRPQYYFGPTMTYTPTVWWTSPTTNTSYPWYGELMTPVGTFYYSPSGNQPAQESIGASGNFIEGALDLHSGSIKGPVVAEGFTELVQLPPLGLPSGRSLPEANTSGNIWFDGGLNHNGPSVVK